MKTTLLHTLPSYFLALIMGVTVASGATITALSTVNSTDAGAYSIQTNLADGVLSYGDRSEEYFDIAANADYLLGADYIRTANDDRNSSVEISFTLLEDATVYISKDDRVGTASFFGDNGFTDTGDNIGNFSSFTSVVFSVFSAELAAGNYTFDHVSNGFSMYTIMAQPIPEPSSFALLAGCFGLAWVMIRRRG